MFKIGFTDGMQNFFGSITARLTFSIGQIFKELRAAATHHHTETSNVLNTIVPLRILFPSIAARGVQPNISTAMTQLLQQATNLNGDYAKMLEKESSVISHLETIMGEAFPGAGGKTMASNPKAAHAWAQFQTGYDQYWPEVQQLLGLSD